MEKKKERENGDFVGFVNNKIASLFTVLEEMYGWNIRVSSGGQPPTKLQIRAYLYAVVAVAVIAQPAVSAFTIAFFAALQVFAVREKKKIVFAGIWTHAYSLRAYL